MNTILFPRCQMCTQMIEAGQHADLDAAVAEKEKRHLVEVQALEAQLDQEEAEMVSQIQSSINEEHTRECLALCSDIVNTDVSTLVTL